MIVPGGRDEPLVLVVLLFIVVVVLVTVAAVVVSCRTEFIRREGFGGGVEGDADPSAAPLVGLSTRFRGCCCCCGGGGDSCVRFLLLRCWAAPCINPLSSSAGTTGSTRKGIIDPSLCRAFVGVLVGDGSMTP